MKTKISVVVTTYNHEKYIAQCLESIIGQKGDFQMEIIVGDDCSRDSTRTIVQKIGENNAIPISLLTSPENIGVTKNLKRCLSTCSGEFIAICEGDDYWTNENKVQIQKEFLEQHKECSMCFSAITLFYEENNLFEPHYDQSHLDKGAITVEDLIEINYIGNFSCCMYRAEVVNKLPQGIYDIRTVDWMFNMACGQFGKIGYIPDQMSVYRLHSKGDWTARNGFEKLYRKLYHIDVYNEFLGHKYDVAFRKKKEEIKGKLLQELSPEMAEKEQTIQRLSAELVEQEQVVQALNLKVEEFNQVKKSRAWRLIQIYRQIKSRLFSRHD